MLRRCRHAVLHLITNTIISERDRVAGRGQPAADLVYFDGKGLYRAPQDRWRTISASANRDDLPLPDVVAAFPRLGVEQRSSARVLAWDGLSGSAARSPEDGPFFTAMVEDLRRRQERGELAADLDPEYVLLKLLAAAPALTVIPQIVAASPAWPPKLRSSGRRTPSSWAR